jgi:hypothetical protein
VVKVLHREAGLIDAYDAAVLENRPDGKTKIVKKHETPTRAGGVLGGGFGLATGLGHPPERPRLFNHRSVPRRRQSRVENPDDRVDAARRSVGSPCH